MDFLHFGLAGTVALGLACLATVRGAEAPTEIFYHGKVITMDPASSIQEAIAIAGDKIIAVGKDAEILALAGAKTHRHDLGGRTLLPGLMDSHTHPAGAAMTEFDHEIPPMESIADVLAYIHHRAEVLPEGAWIHLTQVFITRLREQRYPTRQELDQAAPKHPVVFSTGPDSMLNTLALRLSGITKDFQPPDRQAGRVELDPQTGEATGLLRGLTRFVKIPAETKKPSNEDVEARLALLFKDYNSVGLTAVGDRDCLASTLDRYASLKQQGKLSVRVMVSHDIMPNGLWRSVEQNIAEVTQHPVRVHGDSFLRIIGTKCFLDGGMLTGSAYMREPWGVSQTYGITDPAYRGTLYIPHERLVQLVDKITSAGLQFTAHTVGDGATHELLDVYEEVNRRHPVAPTRSCLTHSNFMLPEDVERAGRLGIMLDVQPIWLHLDSRTLLAQFGQERTRRFQPLKSLFAAGVVVGGGSDHMQKIGSFRSVNPYNPWLGMWTAITRQARWMDEPMHPEQALTREQALRMYTTNNAKILFLDGVTGSLEVGKSADLIIVDRDPLDCPLADLVHTQVIQTWLAGRQVYGASHDG